MKKRLAFYGSPWVAIGVALARSLAAPSLARAARKLCSNSDPEDADTGKRMKCKMENLNDAFDGVAVTALGDESGAFSKAQKKQLENLNKRAKNETERTSSACVAPTLVAEGLNVLATTFEVIDGGETAERLDAMGACVQKTGGEIQEVRALVERLLELLEKPPGQRFP